MIKDKPEKGKQKDNKMKRNTLNKDNSEGNKTGKGPCWTGKT